MHEPGRHPGAGGVGNACRHLAEEARRQFGRRRLGIDLVGEMMPRRVPHQHLDTLGIVHVPQALEAADADMAVRQPDKHRRTRR